MNRSKVACLAVAVTLISAPAWAVKVGETLYIRSKDTALLKEPKANSQSLMKLQPGTEVVWNGPSEKDKSFHEVVVGGKKGFVLMSSLSPNKPQTEIDSSSGKPMSAAAFANSGAAVKDGDMGRGGNYAQRSPAESAAAAELIYVEELNKAKATPQALRAKEKELNAR